MTGSSKGYQGLGMYAARIAPIIPQMMDELEATLPDLSTAAKWALNQTRAYSERPSKRIRGSLAAAAYDAKKGTTMAEAGLQLGAAIEALQNYLLIIDDVIDQSDTRRGDMTVHEAYKRDFATSDREADMIGILVGLLPSQLATHIIAQIDEAPEPKFAMLRLLARDMIITDLAQIDDIRQQFGESVSRDELIRKHGQKSSYYSFINPLSCGLILAGADERVARDDAEKFGLPAGIAFQLRDDYLGVFGEVSETGKPNLDDMREGKYTLMVHFAEELGTDDDRERLAAILGDTSADEAELAELQTILRRTGADEHSMELARTYADKAVHAAQDASSWDAKFASMLVGLVEFSIGRKG